eukprot:scaffold116005_cov63-Attheya_sp.AAC.1
MAESTPTTTPPGPALLRWIIVKRFSNETILWYMSKEVNVHREDTSHVVSVDLIDSNQPQTLASFSLVRFVGNWIKYMSPESQLNKRKTAIVDIMEDKALAGHALISMHVPPLCEIDNDIYHII